MKPTTQPKIRITKDTSHTVLVRKRDWNDLDAKYWSQYNITQSLLEYYNVYACKEVWISRYGRTKLYYSYTRANPAYAYFFNYGDYKIYNPFTKSFYMVKGHLEGYDQLPNSGSTLIITKSMKDVITLRSFGVLAIAKSGESALLTKTQYADLAKRFNHIYSLFDYDYAGICAANKIKKEYCIQPIFIPFKRLLLGKPDFKVKDISDFTKEYGTVKTSKLITACLETNMNIKELYNYVFK